QPCRGSGAEGTGRAWKRGRKGHLLAGFVGKSPPPMPLIPPMRPLKNISSTTENPIRAPPIAADRNGCMNNPPSGGAMMFRQLFDQTSGTYSYLLASRPGGEALIIDPVLEKVDRYLQLVKELDLKLVKSF